MGILDDVVRDAAAIVYAVAGGRAALRYYEADVYDKATHRVTRTARHVLVDFVSVDVQQQTVGLTQAQGAAAGVLHLAIPAAGLEDLAFWRTADQPDTDDRVILEFTNFGTEADPIVEGGTAWRVIRVDPHFAGDLPFQYVLTVVRA